MLFTINDQATGIDADVRTSLLDLLREHLGLILLRLYADGGSARPYGRKDRGQHATPPVWRVRRACRVHAGVNRRSAPFHVCAGVRLGS